jgi:hypothetical protein
METTIGATRTILETTTGNGSSAGAKSPEYGYRFRMGLAMGNGRISETAKDRANTTRSTRVGK